MDGVRQSSFTPSLTPTSEEEHVLWLRLLRSRRVGISTFHRLMREHGCAARALDALPDLAQEAGVPHYTPASAATAQSELRAARKSGAKALWIGSLDYPASLLDLRDPPPLLWARGNTEYLHVPAVAMVGARNASSLGGRMARLMARDLGAAGYVTVSGLARGIDAAAHEGSLKTGTIAILGGGVDQIYPRENATLYSAICDTGLVLSEQPMGLKPKAPHFPKRNRLIAALGRALVVIEAAARSGSLISARDALDLGRDVLAVPGHPLDPRAAGGNMLIRDGAMLARSAGDVIEAMGQITPLPAPAPRAEQKTDLRALHQQILNRLGSAPLPEDQLLRDIGAPAQQLARCLSELELTGHLRREPGGLLVRLHERR